MCLVKHAFARVTSAIFVSFTGLSKKALVYWLECKFVIFAVFVKKNSFGRGQRNGLPKTPFVVAPRP